MRPNNNLKSFILFYFHLLRKHLQFLRPKAFKKLLQSSLHTGKNFSARIIIGTHQNQSRSWQTRSWQNRLKNLLKPTVNLSKTVEKRSKIKTMKQISENWGALQFLVFFKQKHQKTYSNVELKKTEIFRSCPYIQGRVCYVVCLVFRLGLCGLHVKTKEELNKQKYYKN